MCFAVFGASEQEAIKLTKRRLKSIEKDGAAEAHAITEKWPLNKPKTILYHCYVDVVCKGVVSEENYEKAMVELSKQYMQTMSPKQISPMYGAPERCLEYINLAKRYGSQRMQIKQKVREPCPKKAGNFITSWKEITKTQTAAV